MSWRGLVRKVLMSTGRFAIRAGQRLVDEASGQEDPPGLEPRLSRWHRRCAVLVLVTIILLNLTMCAANVVGIFDRGARAATTRLEPKRLTHDGLVAPRGPATPVVLIDCRSGRIAVAPFKIAAG